MDQLAVSPREACRMLSIGLTRFYQLLAEGEFETFHIGKSRRVKVSSIHAFIEKRVAQTRSDNR